MCCREVKIALYLHDLAELPYRIHRIGDGRNSSTTSSSSLQIRETLHLSILVSPNTWNGSCTSRVLSPST